MQKLGCCCRPQAKRVQSLRCMPDTRPPPRSPLGQTREGEGQPSRPPLNKSVDFKTFPMILDLQVVYM